MCILHSSGAFAFRYQQGMLVANYQANAWMMYYP